MSMKFDPLEYVKIPDELKTKKISILMPFLNEEKRIVQNVYKVKEYLSSLSLNYEIVLIDDGSADNSYELLKENFSNDETVKIIKNYKNFGKGWALKTGYEFSSGEFILFIDSDLELSIEHLPNFLKKMYQENVYAVIGSKLHPDSIVNYPFYRKIMSFGYYSIVKFLFGLPIMDTQTGIKLFKREALELALPKVIVKRFAFDIELLLILFKHKLKVVSAPIKLDFSRKFGWNFNFNVILKTFIDTFAVWYRDKILKFYDRPLGENKKFFYSIVLFSYKNDEFEKMAFKTFTSILYPYYEIILIGEEKFESPKEYKFLKLSNSLTEIEKLQFLIDSSLIKGDVVVFSRLTSFVDERFLYNVSRILSLPDVGGVGGYILPSENSGFQILSHRIAGSFFLNFNLTYRYKPVNFKEVRELNINGLFVKKDILLTNFEIKNSGRLEYLISELIHKSGKKIYYSPDIMIYTKFPENLKELFLYVKNNAISRGEEFKNLIKRKELKILSIGYFLPILFLIWILISLFFMNKFTVLFLAIYYGIILISRFIYGFKAFFDGFLISILQIYYSIFYLLGIFKNNK